MWGTATKSPRGELLLTGPRAPIPEETSNTLAALADVSGLKLLRAAEVLLTTVDPPRIPKETPKGYVRGHGDQVIWVKLH